MISLKSPKSSELAKTFYQKCVVHHVLITIQLNFKNWEITKIKSYAANGFRTRNVSFEATEHLRNRMRKENCRKLP